MGEEVKQKIFKHMKKIGKIVLIGVILLVLLVSLFWAAIEGIFSGVSEVFEGISDKIKIEGNNIVIEEDYYEEAKERLEKMGVNSETLGLGNDEKYLERYLEAEIVNKLSIFRRRRITRGGIF